MLPAQISPPLKAYIPPPPTAEDLDFADLAVIDLSKASTLEGQAELVQQTRKALSEVGFFYVVNHGYSPSQTARIFDIANLAFDQVSDEEKKEYARKDQAVYQGYKLRKEWVIDAGVRDEIEHYSIHRNVVAQEHPAVLRPFIPELAAFTRQNHYQVLHPILRLLAKGLELPEDTFTKMHGFDAPGYSSMRFQKYHPRADADEVLAKNVWLKGHTDIGTVTILYSQPIGGLQILSPDNKWRWIKHVDNALVVNVGNGIEFLSGGYYRATKHRVVQPPADQQNIPRLGVFYFSMANDDVKLSPLVQSPLLQREGIKKYFTDGEAPTMEEWRRERTSRYGTSQLKPSVTEEGVEEEIIHGTVIKHFN
ncbi:hypothetical protein PC9H_000114 [Pleurotus ostreatus]|uniref:Fe2OG dioxygenase domain-containing protein n=1 Tax=Pleurotus ostreatus TaxID=5322 RepID=A0A8H7DXI3_PLEOS|nr:uncharacterized protein PC9H_000114 [Pleurotus ostreatus]KAF7439778.1 hypothetical protein PC9H_000114 [Pleurotus ostreatus]